MTRVKFGSDQNGKIVFIPYRMFSWLSFFKPRRPNLPQGQNRYQTTPLHLYIQNIKLHGLLKKTVVMYNYIINTLYLSKSCYTVPILLHSIHSYKLKDENIPSRYSSFASRVIDFNVLSLHVGETELSSG